MSWVTLGVGIALLLFGRRLFWLFLAGTGFAIGAWLSVAFLRDQPEFVTLGAAIVLGIAGAMLAFMAQKLAVGLGGFFAGAYLGNAFQLAFPLNVPVWVPPVVGGIVGALLLAALFNWALIALSSLLGAAVIAQNVPLVSPWPVVLFFALLCFGLALQTRQIAGRKKKSSDKSD